MTKKVVKMNQFVSFGIMFCFFVFLELNFVFLYFNVVFSVGAVGVVRLRGSNRMGSSVLNIAFSD